MTTSNSSELYVGLKHTDSLVVSVRHTVPHVEPSWAGFIDMPPVLATAMMIGFIEQTCIEGLRPYLSLEQRSVGTHVDVSHIAATPVGMRITATIELTAVEGRSLVFKVECHDAAGLIGAGTHRRAIIDLIRFNERLREKSDG